MFPTQRSSEFEELNENKGKNGNNLIYGDNLLNGGAGFYSNIDNEETKSWISPRSFKDGLEGGRCEYNLDRDGGFGGN